MKIKVISDSPRETQQIASFFMSAILKRYHPSRHCLVVSLEGPLGGGKTEFLKGIAKFLKIKPKVFSPTFLIMKSFPCADKFFDTLWHLDCYRLKGVREMKELDFPEIMKNPKNLVFVEWGNKIKRILPADYLKIRFKILGDKKRILEFHL